MPENVPPVSFFSDFLKDDAFSRGLCDRLVAGLPWRQDSIILFGKPVLQPRLVAFVADQGVSYKYSGHRLPISPWTTELLTLKLALENRSGVSFNSVLCNLYRTGNDSMGWHSDDEKSLGINPVIASVSLGATRVLRFRRKKSHGKSVGIVMNHGSLLMMQDDCQHLWQHSVPKTKSQVGIRLNLTFRNVIV